MKNWHAQYLGLEQLPADITEIELSHFFSYSQAEMDAIRARRGNSNRLALAVQIGFMRMAGRSLEALEVLPRALLQHLGTTLQVEVPDIASLRNLYCRGRTRFEHQQVAMRALGFRSWTTGRRRVLATRLFEEARTLWNRFELERYARRWLYDLRVLIPGERTLADMVRTAQARVEEEIAVAVHSEIPAEERQRWLEAAFSEYPPYGTALEWLSQPPQKRSASTISEQLRKIEHLKELGVHRYRLSGVELCRQRAYAREVRRRRPVKVQQLQERRRNVEVVCFLRVTLLEATDIFLSLVDMRVAKITRNAVERVREKDARLVRPLLECLDSIRGVIEDSSSTADERLEQVLALLPERSQPKSLAARVRAEMSTNARRTRPLARQLSLFELEEGGDAEVTKALATLAKHFENNNPRLPRQIEADFAPRWSALIDDEDRHRAFRAYEAAVLQQLRKGVRNGSIWSSHSLEHCNREQVFISEADWERHRARYYRRLGVSQDVDKVLGPLQSALTAGLEGLAAAVCAGEVEVDEDGIHVTAIEKEDVPDGLDKARDMLLARVGTTQFPDLMLEVDNQTRFSWAILGRPPRDEKELLALYGALIAHGTETDVVGTSLMIPGLSEAAITSAMRVLENDTALKRANAAVLDFMRQHPIVDIWGGGKLVSSDAMSLEATRHLWNARVDPKHRRYAMGLYTHVLDQWGIVYDQPIVLGRRQAGAAIDGVMRQPTTANVALLAVDTHGYTNFAMFIAKLLGFDLCPRLQHLKDRKLYLPSGFQVPDELRDVVADTISVPAIRAGWDGGVRVAASIHSGHTTATLALQRFGSAARGNPTHKASTALGMLYRTLYLCDYCSNRSFRRELLRVLNYGESVHCLQHALYTGNIAPERGRRAEELAAISGSLALMANMVMAWMTHRLQKAWDQCSPGQVSPELVRHIAPVQFSGINFRGRLRFQIAKYAHRLLSRETASRPSTIEASAKSEPPPAVDV